MSKIISYTALLYGKAYLGYALRSVEPYVDEMWVLYAAGGGSHGSRTSIPCPDTREELYAIAKAVAGPKLRWVDGNWQQEGEQRGAIHLYAPDADVIVVVDSDEIYQPKLIESVLNYAFTVTNSIPPFRYMRVPIIHYWRSFYRAVMHDPAFPIRVIFPRIEARYGENTYGDGVINHMGYAISSELMLYKWQVHGHKNELRRDIDWFKERWQVNAQADCHPVGSEWWNPEAIDPLDYMPAFMHEHPYAGGELIR